MYRKVIPVDLFIILFKRCSPSVNDWSKCQGHAASRCSGKDNASALARVFYVTLSIVDKRTLRVIDVYLITIVSTEGSRMLTGRLDLRLGHVDDIRLLTPP